MTQALDSEIHFNNKFIILIITFNTFIITFIATFIHFWTWLLPAYLNTRLQFQYGCAQLRPDIGRWGFVYLHKFGSVNAEPVKFVNT